jgi:cell division protein FtsB
MKQRLAILALCLILSGLQYRLWAGEGGVFDTRRLQQAVDEQARGNTQLQLRNAVLEAEVADLRNSGAAIEAHARSELGMIRKGEAFYLVVGPNAQPPTTRQ